tara:strand:+ start:6301 stop:7299 length:999 start_codon:yes stop_codon:yes gene_type:complete
MATVGGNYLTLADLYSRQDENKQIASIIEMLAETNPVLDDAVVLECNNGTKHLTTTRTGLPGVTWRRLYEGVTPSKSTTVQVNDTTGMLEAWSEIDAKLVDISNDPAGTRESEATSFLEAMNNEMATGLFYHDTATDPEKFMGLAPRFDSTSADNGQQIVLGDGSGSDNTSIWMVVWGERTCHLLYPQGTTAGFARDDKGKQTKESSNSVYDVYREKFTWDVGLSVRDWRYVSRVANIDVSNLTVNAASGTNLIEKMIKAYYKLHQRKVTGGKAVVYCNTTIKEYLHHQAMRGATGTVQLRLDQASGDEFMTFLGIPVRECDAILNTEAAIS